MVPGRAGGPIPPDGLPTGLIVIPLMVAHPPRKLKIGLLVCDHVLPEMLPIAGSYQNMFTALFSERPEIELRPYDLLGGQHPESPAECDGWISTGSKWSVSDDEPWIGWLAGFVRRLYEARSPHVGICFGSQMIAHALGGEVTGQAAGWGVGVAHTEVIGQTEWMIPRLDSYRVVVSYQDQITKLPPESRLWASTDHCPVSMFTMGDHFLGVGGHPEIPIPYIKALIESRRGNRIPETTAAAGLSSLKNTPDATLLRDWITEFLLGSARDARTHHPAKQ